MMDIYRRIVGYLASGSTNPSGTAGFSDVRKALASSGLWLGLTAAFFSLVGYVGAHPESLTPYVKDPATASLIVAVAIFLQRSFVLKSQGPKVSLDDADPTLPTVEQAVVAQARNDARAEADDRRGP